jgi:hypothetical protein
MDPLTAADLPEPEEQPEPQLTKADHFLRQHHNTDRAMKKPTLTLIERQHLAASPATQSSFRLPPSSSQ